MALRLTLPLGKDDNIKDLIFSILSKEYPLKIVELTNFIKKRYGRSVTFQAVRKAALELVKEGIVKQQGKEYLINKNWVFETKKQLDQIFLELTEKKSKPEGIDSIHGEVSVFTFDSLNEMMKFWEEIIDDWYKNFKKGDHPVNCWQGAHGWEALLHPDTETKIMSQLKKKGIKSYAVSTGSTPLDKNLWKFYKKIGLKVKLYPSSKTFDRSYYVGTYGDTIVQAKYPSEITDELDHFFKKNKSLENLDLTELSEIGNKKRKVKLTVIKNLAMAKQINKSIIDQID